MEPRLATATWVSALIRRASAAGAFAAVLRRGDAAAGAVILVARHRDGAVAAYARIGGGAQARWQRAASAPPGDPAVVDKYLATQARYDDDLWAIELVTDDIERLVDEPFIPG